jgi:hypothetical protein
MKRSDSPRTHEKRVSTETSRVVERNRGESSRERRSFREYEAMLPSKRKLPEGQPNEEEGEVARRKRPRIEEY